MCSLFRECNPTDEVTATTGYDFRYKDIIFKKLVEVLDLSEADKKSDKQLIRNSRYKGFDKYTWKNRKLEFAMKKYLYIVPSVFVPFVFEVVSHFRDAEEDSLMDVLKEISVRATRSFFSSSDLKYTYILDLVKLLGYDTIRHRSFDGETALDPFLIRKEQKDKVLEPYIEDVINNIGFTDTMLSFKQYISFRDGWAAGGSSNRGKRVKLLIEDKKGITKSITLRDKFSAFIDWSDNKILKECLVDRDVEVGTFVKSDEPGKARLVQGYDAYSFIRCSYLESMISDLNLGKQWTSIGYKSKQTLDMYSSLLGLKGWRVAVDQSAFDLHQSKQIVVYAIRVLLNAIKANAPRTAQVVETELRSLENVYLNFGDRRGKWENGLLSGYKFTALIGSILNAAAFNYVIKHFNSSILLSRFQGDDAVAVLKNSIDMKRLANIYASIGKEVNVLKSWQSMTKTDYLHLIFDSNNNSVLGFPASIAKSLIWKKPGLQDTYSLKGKINELNSLLLKGKRRGLTHMDDILIRFVKSKTNLDVISIKKWVFSKKVYGGGGFGKLDFILDIKSDYQLTGFKVSLNINLDNKYFKGMNELVMSRYRDKVPIPGVTHTVKVYSLKKQIKKVNFEEVKHSADCVNGVMAPRLDWSIRDIFIYGDAYKRKLFLESRLLENKRIKITDLPPLWPQNIRPKHYRSLVHAIQKGRFNLDNMVDDPMKFFSISDYYYSVWRKICTAKYLNRIRKDLTQVEFQSTIYRIVGIYYNNVGLHF
jgi:hypothetical protein